MSNTLFYIIVAILLFDFILDKILNQLNLKHQRNQLPNELSGIYDPEKYRKSQEYYRVNHYFVLITSTFSFLLMLVMLFFQGFAWLDEFVRQYTQHPIWTALLFFGILGFASDILGIPFSLYHTFVIEEKFGFNKTTVRTFIVDKIKGYFIAAIMGGALLALIVWIYTEAGKNFWIYAWIVMGIFMLLMTMFYASVILPLFNKLTPMPEGELRTAIEDYCKKVNFRLDNLFVMDGSKRSSKANAFFSGLGGKKKIVLYDTLIEKHSIPELVAVLAHEIGHYKKKHTRMGVLTGILQTGLMLFILSRLINSPELSQALGSENASFHLGILAFGMLYSPLSELLGIITHAISRKNEFEADRFAAETYGAEPLQMALKKLSSDNLSNLNPHPAYVFVHYSHPPLLQRLRALAKAGRN